MAARKRGPYYHKFMELGAEMVDRMGFDTALKFTSVEEEHRATRERAGLYDVYYQGPLEVKGRDAHKLLQGLLVNDLERIDDGGVIYSSLCNAEGGMLDDLTCYRLSGDLYWLIATPSRSGVVNQWVAEHARDLNAYVTDIVPGTGYASVQGPKSREILAKLTDADLSTEALPYYRLTEATVAEVPAVVSRTGYSGELGYELYYSRDYAEHMWDALLAAGQEFDMLPCGLGALRTVRMEKKYPLYGLDLSDGNSPYEGNLAWTVRLNKGDFIGREALARQKEQGVARLLVGLDLGATDFLPAVGDAVSLDDQPVGKVTSADRGHYLGKSLAMGYVAREHAQAGARLMVTSAASGESYPATVQTKAFWDPEMARAKA
jgi:aminomethyltransferase